MPAMFSFRVHSGALRAQPVIQTGMRPERIPDLRLVAFAGLGLKSLANAGTFTKASALGRRLFLVMLGQLSICVEVEPKVEL